MAESMERQQQTEVGLRSNQASGNYENAEIFLSHLGAPSSDPFDEDFEKSLEGVPRLPVRRLSRAVSEEGKSLNTRASKKLSYDEVSINAGQPVLTGDAKGGDSLTMVQFGSPIKEEPSPDPRPRQRPVPAPRLSIQNLQTLPKVPDNTKEEHESDEGEVLYEELVPKPIPRRLDTGSAQKVLTDVDLETSTPTPYAVENIYCELDLATAPNQTAPGQVNLLEEKPDLEDEDDEGSESEDTILDDLDRRGSKSLLDSKLTTIDIRKDVNKLWESAVKELDRDESLVEFIENHEKREPAKKITSLSYHSVAIPEQRFKLINGVQVPIPVTLLKDFDPCFENMDEAEVEKATQSRPISRGTSVASSTTSSSEGSSIGPESEVKMREYKDEPRPAQKRSEAKSSESHSTTSVSSLDLPPPSIPPPEPPRSYENVWIPPSSTPQILPASESALQCKRRSFRLSDRIRSEDGACALPDPDVSKTPSPTHSLITNPSAKEASSSVAGLKNIQRSASTTNLSFITKKLSFAKIGRKISDQVMKPTLFPKEDRSEQDNPVLISQQRRKSSALDQAWPSKVSHSGPLFVMSAKTSKRGSGHPEKWVVLGNVNLRYFNSDDSMAEPKETILLKDVLSLSKRQEQNSNGEVIFCFDIGYISNEKGMRASNKLTVRTFGSPSPVVRDGWMEKICHGLSNQLVNMELRLCLKLGWAYLKVMFAGDWNLSWISLHGTKFVYTVKDEVDAQEVDLRKAKNITLVKDVKNLNAPENCPVLVVDFIDRSLYLQCRHEKESLNWKSLLEDHAFRYVQ